jgi:hypothetical protein
MTKSRVFWVALLCILSATKVTMADTHASFDEIAKFVSAVGTGTHGGSSGIHKWESPIKIKVADHEGMELPRSDLMMKLVDEAVTRLDPIVSMKVADTNESFNVLIVVASAKGKVKDNMPVPSLPNFDPIPSKRFGGFFEAPLPRRTFNPHAGSVDYLMNGFEIVSAILFIRLPLDAQPKIIESRIEASFYEMLYFLLGWDVNRFFHDAREANLAQHFRARPDGLLTLLYKAGVAAGDSPNSAHRKISEYLGRRK